MLEVVVLAAVWIRRELADAASMAAPLYSILSPQSRRLGGKDLGSRVE
jgi:hypothetical protein